jgi:hypothetical protein
MKTLAENRQPGQFSRNVEPRLRLFQMLRQK